MYAQQKSLANLITEYDTFKRSYLFSFCIIVLVKPFFIFHRIQDLTKKLTKKQVIEHIQYVVCQF